MEKSKPHFHFHVSEATRNAIIIAVIVTVAAILTYFEWRGKSGH